MAFRAASRYARALADVVGASGDFPDALADLDAFANAYRESTELRELFDSPAVPVADQLRVLAIIGTRLKLSTPVANFLGVIVRNHRMRHFEDVHTAFRRVANQRMGIVEVKIVSARELTAAERKSLVAHFNTLTGSQVQCEFQVDPGLVGGAMAQVGSTIYDGSVRGALDRVREQLTAA